MCPNRIYGSDQTLCRATKYIIKQQGSEKVLSTVHLISAASFQRSSSNILATLHCFIMLRIQPLVGIALLSPINYLHTSLSPAMLLNVAETSLRPGVNSFSS